MNPQDEKLAAQVEAAKAAKKRFNPNARVPNELNVRSGDLSENFLVFKAMFENYSQAAVLYVEDREFQVATLLSAIGPDAFKLYPTLDKTENPGEETLEGTFKLLEQSLSILIFTTVFKKTVRYFQNTWQE